MNVCCVVLRCVVLCRIIVDIGSMDILPTFDQNMSAVAVWIGALVDTDLEAKSDELLAPL